MGLQSLTSCQLARLAMDSLTKINGYKPLFFRATAAGIRSLEPWPVVNPKPYYSMYRPCGSLVTSMLHLGRHAKYISIEVQVQENLY